MLTDSKLKSQVDQLWEKFWSGGLSNPLDAIEQFSFLLFMKRLDDEETKRENTARRLGTSYETLFRDEEGNPAPSLRWSQWRHKTGDTMLDFVKKEAFPFIRHLAGNESAFAQLMQNAEFKINRPTLLAEACSLIEAMNISQQNQDVQGDLYEYLLDKLNTSGRNGQFRTPRHVIRLMTQMIEPKPTERICDPAAGTGGFLVNSYQYILEQGTDPQNLTYDEDGFPHGLDGAMLTEAERDHLQKGALTGFDNDSGMTMLRIGAMNLLLHGIRQPRFRYQDTLSKGYTEARKYDVILANPPFKGAIDKDDVSGDLPGTIRKTELLFLHLMLRLLEMGGRCAVIVPDGVLFGSSRAHIETRKMLIEMNGLQGVVSMPSGVFKPYAGVSTAILIFAKGGTTDRIWFYDMEHDGFSLDDKRQRTGQNDLPDILDCWRKRKDAVFADTRQTRQAELKAALEPLKTQRLGYHAEINRLTFENAIAGEDDAEALARLDTDKARLAELEAQIHPLQDEYNRLTRQFWVTKEQVRANRYDLSASRYRPMEQDAQYHDAPQVTLSRLHQLEDAMRAELCALEELLK